MAHVDDDRFIEAVKRAVVEHNGGAEEADELAERLRGFTLGGSTYWRKLFIENDTKPDGGRWGMYDDGDEEAPFFTEAFLYNLVGKDEARSILGIVRQLCKLAGVDFR